MIDNTWTPVVKGAEVPQLQDMFCYIEDQFNDFFHIQKTEPPLKSLKKELVADPQWYECDQTKECVIKDQNKSEKLKETVYIQAGKGQNLTIDNVTASCSPKTDCQIYVLSDGIINIKNKSTLRATLVVVESGRQIILDNSSSLDANATANLPGQGHYKTKTKSGQDVIHGASNAGQAGLCQTSPQQGKVYGKHFQIFDNNTDHLEDFIGSSGGINDKLDQKTNGGGAIVLKSSQFNLYGRVDASAMSNENINKSSNIEVSGGSGGYILIFQTGNRLIAQNEFRLNMTVNGGDSFGDISSAGSGGRIVIDVGIQDESQFNGSSQFIQNSLGGTAPKIQGQPCKNGAPGTIYYNTSNTLFIQGSQETISKNDLTLISKKTQISQEKHLSKLDVSGSAIASPELNFTDQTVYLKVDIINIHGLGQLGLPITNNITNIIKITIISENITLRSSGQISWALGYHSVNETLITANNTILMESESQMDLQLSQNTFFYMFKLNMSQSTNIYAGLNLTMNGTYQFDIHKIELKRSNEIGDKTKAFIYSSKDAYLIQNGYIKSDYLALISQNFIGINGKISPSSSAKEENSFDKCEQKVDEKSYFSFVKPDGSLIQNDTGFLESYNDFFAPKTNLTEVNGSLSEGLFQNFTTTIIAYNTLQFFNGSTMRGPRLAAYSQKYIMDDGSLIDASGYGCLPGQGIGSGSWMEGCGGQGGSHASLGGNPYPQNQSRTNVSQCLANKTQILQKTYGSPSVGMIFEGSGGGTQVGNEGGRGGGIIWLQANEMSINGIIISEGEHVTTNGGAGSGGTIVLATNYFQGYSKGIISVEGGEAKGNGGAGSGGRFKLFRFDWTKEEFYSSQDQYNLTLLTKGGISKMKDGRKGSYWQTPCPLGYAGFGCLKCNSGFYSHDFYDDKCQACFNMPNRAKENAEYYLPSNGTDTQISPICPYRCKVEKMTQMESNPLCLENFPLFIYNIGGYNVFILAIVSVIFSVIILLYCILKANKKQKNIEKLIEEGDQFIIGKNQNESKIKFGKGSKTVNQELIEKNLKFFDNDIYMHFGRVYLLGTNHVNQKWKIPTHPPAKIRKQINVNNYTSFVENMNAKIKMNYSSWVQNLIFLFYPALYPYYISKNRQRNCQRLIHEIEGKFSGADIWKCEEQRMRDHIVAKLTFSRDNTLSYIDFLDTQLTQDAFEGPQFPQTFILGGEGKFHNPYELDFYSDPIIKSIGMISTNPKMWKKFLKNLNSKLAQILPNHQFNFLLKSSIFEVLEFISLANQQLFQNDGFKISMWIIEIQNGEHESYYKMDIKYLKNKSRAFNNFLSYWRRNSVFSQKSEFKIALVLQGIVDQHYMDDHMRDRITSFDSPSKRPGQVDNQSDTSVQMMNNGRDTLISPAQGRATRNKRSTGQTHYNKVDSIQFITANMREPHIDQSWLKQFKETQKFIKQDFCLWILGCIHVMALRHVKNNINIVALVILMVILVSSDCILTMVLLQSVTLLPRVARKWPQIAIMLLIYPMQSIISPILGVVSMIYQKQFLTQYFAYFNLISLVSNIMIFLLYEMLDNNDDFFGEMIAGLLIAAKLVLAQIIPQLIAYFRNTQYKSNKAFLDLVKPDSEISESGLESSAYNKAPVENNLFDKNAFNYSNLGGKNTQSERRVVENKFNESLDDSFDDNLGQNAPLYKENTLLSIE